MKDSTALIMGPCSQRGRKFLLSLGGLAVLVVSLSGCGAQQLQQMARGELQAPKVSFQGLKIYRPTGQGWPLGATLLLDNPNAQALDLMGYDYQLWIDGKSVARGTSRQPVNLPPLGQTVAELPVLVETPAILELLPRFLPQLKAQSSQPPKFHYQIAGSFRLASVLGGIIPVPFSFQGKASPREGMDFLKPYLR